MVREIDKPTSMHWGLVVTNGWKDCETVSGAIPGPMSATRKSARTVHDALPLMGPLAKVTVLTVEAADAASAADRPSGAAITDHLSRHELKVSSARTVTADGLSPADALLDYASDLRADLLVVGGYGHSRTRDMVLGGVTRDLLGHMTLPVLMSH